MWETQGPKSVFEMIYWFSLLFPSNPHHHLKHREKWGINNFLQSVSVFCHDNYSLWFLNRLLEQINSSPMCNPSLGTSFSSSFRLVYTRSNAHLLPRSSAHLLPRSRFAPDQRGKFCNTRSSNNCWKSDLHSISVLPNEDWLGTWKDLVLFGYFFFPSVWSSRILKQQGKPLRKYLEISSENQRKQIHFLKIISGA